MQTDFEAIERYLVASKELYGDDTADDGMVVTLDQQVPKSSILIGEKDVMFSDSSMETYYMNIDEVIKLDDFTGPIPSQTTCIQISDANNQLSRETGSPDLLDLDDQVSLYEGDIAVRVKTEKPWQAESYSQNYCQHQQTVSYSDDKDIQYLALQQCKQEIEAMCHALGIGPDPCQWSTLEVQSWVQSFSQQYPNTNIDLFQMSGAQLCMLSESDFKLRAPDAGADLYSRLEIWKMCKFDVCQSPAYSESSYQSYNDQSYDQGYVSASSPSPSVTSEDSLPSSVSSLNGSHHDEEFHFIRPHSDDKYSDDRIEQKQTIHLHQFLKELLLNGDCYTDCIKWIDRSRGIFKIEDSAKVAKLWGKRKNRPAMNYDKLSRSIRQYYKKGIIKKTEHSKRLVYQFCPGYL